MPQREREALVAGELGEAVGGHGRELVAGTAVVARLSHGTGAHRPPGGDAAGATPGRLSMVSSMDTTSAVRPCSSRVVASWAPQARETSNVGGPAASLALAARCLASAKRPSAAARAPR